MRIAMIWAMDKNRVIGRNNALPWRLSSDLRHFKKVTLGKPVIMGRKTWESLGRPLPGRPNIVISSSTGNEQDGVTWVTGLQEALDTAKDWLNEQNQDEAIIMGGAQIYKLAFPLADRLYITEVSADVEGDTAIECFDMSAFTLSNSEQVMASESDEFTFTLNQYDKN